jgi:hypothetical protein
VLTFRHFALLATVNVTDGRNTAVVRTLAPMTWIYFLAAINMRIPAFV